MAISEKNNNMAEAQDDSLQLKDLLALCIGKWKWFHLCGSSLRLSSHYATSVHTLHLDSHQGRKKRTLGHLFGDERLLRTGIV